jgi:hypothetical protein
MKQLILILSLIFFNIAFSQTVTSDTTKLFCITQNDGNKIVGKVTSNTSREVTIVTNDGREIIIPQYVIKSITEVNTSDLNEKGEYIGEDNFRTRYFLTTNGLPLEKGKNYIQWNLFGPDFQFSVTDHLGMGIMSSWIGMPIIGTVKYANKITDKVHYAIGGLVGTGSWIRPDFGGALPFAAITFGTGRSNINFSGGYGAVWSDGSTSGRGILSVGGMTKVGKRVSLVFDSFIMLPGATKSYTDSWGYNYVQTRPGFAILVPGVRFHQTETSAFQFGFGGLVFEDELVPVPIPMVQWYRSF